MRPIDSVTVEEAARILGTSVSGVRSLVLSGRLKSYGIRDEQRPLSQIDVEQLACEIYPWRAHVHEAGSYWVTGGDAAAMLGVHRSLLPQLMRKNQLSPVVHRDGVRLYRRAQLEQLARSREARSQ